MIILWTLTALAFGLVFLSLIMGAKNMGGKTEEARQRSNIWMQALAVGLLLLTVYIQTKSQGG